MSPVTSCACPLPFGAVGMGRRGELMKPAEALRHWHVEIGRAAAPFESRWTMLALRRLEPDLASRLHEQRSLFDEACIKGDSGDIEEQGAAMCRGYLAAVRVLEAAAEPDDAYMLGSDPDSGLKIAVGMQKAALARVRELHGQDVIWITPDEVACLMRSVETFKTLAAVKQVFPTAELIRRYEEAGT